MNSRLKAGGVRKPMVPLNERVIVALDVPTVDDARAVVGTLGDSVGFYKIGLQLLFAGGLGLAERLSGEGKRVFVDAKLLDIPQTVTSAVENVARLGVDCLTVHGDRHALQAAVKGRGDRLKILAVTLLTSLDQADLTDLGIGLSVADYVLLRARHAAAAGCDGIISSAHEVARIRDAVGPDMLLITPGIRSSGSGHDDQRRVATAFDAIRAGADHVVVGREILRAPAPRAAAEKIVAEIEEALAA